MSPLQAHPPIHPLKAVSRSDLEPDAWKVYEFIARHFLACVSQDAEGSLTTVTVSAHSNGSGPFAGKFGARWNIVGSLPTAAELGVPSGHIECPVMLLF